MNWIGTGISKELNLYLKGTCSLNNFSFIKIDEIELQCPDCNFKFNDMFLMNEGEGILLTKFPKYCPECGKFHGTNITDKETNITYFIKTKVILETMKNPKFESGEEDEE